MTVENIFRARRTLKPQSMDSAREVERAVLMEIFEDANWAPTHGLTQPWRFHVFEGASRAGLGAALVAIYDRTTAAGEVRPEKRAKLAGNCELAPVVIAVAARVEPGGKISQLDEICATACAVENLLLSSHMQGLGSFWSTAPVSCSPDFLDWLGLDSTHHALGLIYLGYPKSGATAESTRLPVSDRVVFRGAGA